MKEDKNQTLQELVKILTNFNFSNKIGICIDKNHLISML